MESLAFERVGYPLITGHISMYLVVVLLFTLLLDGVQLDNV